VVEQGTHKPLAGGSNPPSATTPTPADVPSVLADAVDRGCRSLGLSDDTPLVLAVSGGPDSMALLHGSAALVGSRTRRWPLVVAHLDHGLRPESRADAAFVAAAAARLGLPFRGGSADVARLARERGQSLEEAGREARYAFLESVAAPDALIATAHTADDAAETVMINLLRGSGLTGSRGIPERRGRIVRPLLGERRAALRALLDARGIGYLRDPSNDDPAFLRNRVRAELLPLLERLRPGSVAAVARFSRLAAADDALLDLMAAGELERRRLTGGAIDWHHPPQRALARRILRLAIGGPPPSAERIEALVDAAEGSRGGVTIELGGDRRASVRERVITLEWAGPHPAPY
jgi:tRNA(Ile)-lysidine synthase